MTTVARGQAIRVLDGLAAAVHVCHVGLLDVRPPGSGEVSAGSGRSAHYGTSVLPARAPVIGQPSSYQSRSDTLPD